MILTHIGYCYDSVGRVGFACKYMHPDQTQKPKILKEIQQNYSERITTIAWLNRQTRAVAEEKLHDLSITNIQNAPESVEFVGSLPDKQRMLRLGSNMCPHTQKQHGDMYTRIRSIAELEQGWSPVGERAPQLDVRLSMHPGQFCVLASDNP